MPELQNAVVALVREIRGATERPMPEWLDRPGKAECGQRWQLIMRIYSALEPGRVLPEIMPAKERRRIDAVLQEPEGPPRILEVDEKQHFNAFRAATLRLYPTRAEVAFPILVWIERSEAKRKLEGGGFAVSRPPLFPGENGRHRQRAFRDALCDLLPPLHGYAPTLRIADFEVKEWIQRPDAADRMEALLNDRLTAGAE